MISSLKAFFWHWTIRRLSLLVLRADEWVHAQEVKMRESAAVPTAVLVEMDRKQSARREREYRKQARTARPRLRYQGGQFVRVSR